MPPEYTRKTVLIVDDDPVVRDALTGVLVDQGYQIVARADGYEAISVLRDQGAPDLILLAAALPGGMDGYQLCKCLRENAATAQVPMILLSETHSFVSQADAADDQHVCMLVVDNRRAAA